MLSYRRKHSSGCCSRERWDQESGCSWRILFSRLLGLSLVSSAFKVLTSASGCAVLRFQLVPWSSGYLWLPWQWGRTPRSWVRWHKHTPRVCAVEPLLTPLTPPPSTAPATAHLTDLALGTLAFCPSIQHTDLFVPHGLGPCCSFCLECSSFSLAPSDPSVLISSISSQSGLPWALHLKEVSLHLLVTLWHQIVVHDLHSTSYPLQLPHLLSVYPLCKICEGMDLPEYAWHGRYSVDIYGIDDFFPICFDLIRKCKGWTCLGGGWGGVSCRPLGIMGKLILLSFPWEVGRW